MFNLLLNKLKSAINNGTTVTLNFFSKMIDDPNDETNFPHKLLSTDTQASRLCKALVNNSSANTTLLESQLSKMLQLELFLAETFLNHY